MPRPSLQHPKPAQLLGQGRSLQPLPPKQARSWSPAQVLQWRCGPRPARACSPPHNSDTQNPTHTSAAAAACAPTRPGPAKGEGGAGALGEPGGTPPHRCERGAAPVAHLLDEVAGALLREALLPAAGQVCGNARKVVKVGPPRRAPLGGPAPPHPAPAADGRPPERIMWPELTGSPVRGCSQVVQRSWSLMKKTRPSRHTP